MHIYSEKSPTDITWNIYLDRVELIAAFILYNPKQWKWLFSCKKERYGIQEDEILFKLDTPIFTFLYFLG